MGGWGSRWGRGEDTEPSWPPATFTQHSWALLTALGAHRVVDGGTGEGAGRGVAAVKRGGDKGVWGGCVRCEVWGGGLPGLGGGWPDRAPSRGGGQEEVQQRAACEVQGSSSTPAGSTQL